MVQIGPEKTVVCSEYSDLLVGRDLAIFRDEVAYFGDVKEEREKMVINVRKENNMRKDKI